VCLLADIDGRMFPSNITQYVHMYAKHILQYINFCCSGQKLSVLHLPSPTLMGLINLDFVIIQRGLTVSNAIAFSGSCQYVHALEYMKGFCVCVVICHGLNSFTGHWKRYPNLRVTYLEYVVMSAVLVLYCSV